MRSRTFAAATCLAWAHFLGAQTAPPTTPPLSPPPSLQVQSNLVLVPALVLDARGNLVPNLQAGNFQLIDNGILQHLTLEPHTEGQPMDILVVLQTGGAASREFPFFRGMPALLEAMAGTAPHRFGVITFDSRPEEQWDLTPEIAEVDDAFTAPAPGDEDAAILDAVNFGVDELKKTPATHRRVLLLLSQPQDHGSKARADEVVRRVGENNITILSVTFSPEKRWLEDQFLGDRHENPPYAFAPGVPPLLHTFDLGTPLLNAIRAMQHDTPATVAELTGGEHLRFDDRRSLENQLAQLANHLPNRYLLAFEPHPPTPGLHTLHLQLSGDPAPASVTARETYWLNGAPVLSKEPAVDAGAHASSKR